MGPKLRLLAAGDSGAFRRALHAALAADPRLELAGEASRLGAAVELAKGLSPDLVVVDLLFARHGGIAATAQIMGNAPARVILLASEGKLPAAELLAKALLAGALAVLPKPAHAGPHELAAWGRGFAEVALRAGSAPLRAPKRPRSLEVFALVTSTGGPAVLTSLLDSFHREAPPLPILVVQHLARNFSEGLCRWLEISTGLQVETAREGGAPLPGHVYLAPEGRDLEVGPRGLLRTPEAAPDFGPSGDRLLHSLARHLGPQAGAAVLTGMGHDGAQGLLSLAKAGGVTMVQEQSSCTVSGMPEAALALCGAHPVLGLSGIRAVLRQASRGAPVPSLA